jgi:hypothetical protein
VAVQEPLTVPVIPEDTDLWAFQRTRTFRTRTAIQLQPYTREKMKYTAAIRRGGRRLVEELLTYEPQPAQPASSQTEEESFRDGQVATETPVDDADEEEDEEDTEIDMAVSPPVQPEDQDYDEYFARFGEVADGDGDTRLQAITKARLSKEDKKRKEQLKAERQARRVEKELQRELRQRLREEREEKRTKRREERAARERAGAIAPAESGHEGVGGSASPRGRNQLLDGEPTEVSRTWLPHESTGPR